MLMLCAGKHSDHLFQFGEATNHQGVEKITVSKQANQLVRLLKTLLPSSLFLQQVNTLFDTNHKTMTINLHHPILRFYHPQIK